MTNRWCAKVLGSSALAVALAAGAFACGSDSDSTVVPAPVVPINNGDGGPGDGGAQPISVELEVTCEPGEPTSCCHATKKFGGRPGADNSCGADGESCCAYDAIPGGTFNRANNPAFPATLPDFKLGRYLVTTARFKVWMEEGGGLRSKAPLPGAGANPNIPGSGWKAEWNAVLPETPEALALKVYREPGAQGYGCTLDDYPAHADWPINCIDWYQMQAFCAWDGGYAITEAMWEYAVRGGDEQRKYAWGNAAAKDLETQVVCQEGGGAWGFDLWCNKPAQPVPQSVGFATKGKGRWGTYDLQGHFINLLLDESPSSPMLPYPVPCANDCVTKYEGTPPTRAVARGNEFSIPNNLGPSEYNDLANKRIITMRKDFNGEFFGFRCAYPVNWPVSQ